MSELDEILRRARDESPQIVEVLCRKYLARQPGDPRAWTLLFNSVLAQNNFQEVRLLVRTMTERMPADDSARALAVYALARSGFTAEAYRESLAIEARSVESNPAFRNVVACLERLHAGRSPRTFGGTPSTRIAGEIEEFNRGQSSAGGGGVDVVCFLKQDWHMSIQRGIADALRAAGARVYIADTLWFALAAEPKVLVVSEALYGDTFHVRARLPGCRIVNTRHGLGDKNHAALGASQSDFICVSSDAFAGLLEHETLVNREKLWVTGFPQMDSLFRGAAGRSAQRDAPEKTVLFAPTFNPGLSAGFLLADDLVSSIRGTDDDIRIIVRPHPLFTRGNPGIIEKWSREALVHRNVVLDLDPGSNLMDLFAQCDVMISDVSSAALAWFAVGRPLICVIDRAKAALSGHYSPDGLEWKMQEAAVLVDRPGPLHPAVVGALEDPGRQASERDRFRTFLFGDCTDGFASDRVAARVLDLLKEADR